MVSLGVAAALSACVSGSGGADKVHVIEWKEPTAAPSRTASLAPTAPARPLANSVLRAGEQMQWRLTLHGIELGEFTLAVGAPGVVAGRPVVIVKSKLESTGSTAMLKRIEQEMTTWLATDTGRPLRYRRDFVAGSELAWVELGDMSGAGFEVAFQRVGGEPESRQQTLPDAQGALCLNSLLMAARGWTAQPGERVAFYLLRETMVWRGQFELGTRETIRTPIGVFPVVRIDAIARPVSRTAELLSDREPKRYSVWITDDTNRLPVAIIAETKLGDVRFDLIVYER